MPISSKKRPRKTSISCIRIRMIQRFTAMPETKFAIISSPPTAEKTEMKQRAPIVIHRIIAVVLAVEYTDSLMFSQVSLR